MAQWIESGTRGIKEEGVRLGHRRCLSCFNEYPVKDLGENHLCLQCENPEAYSRLMARTHLESAIRISSAACIRKMSARWLQAPSRYFPDGWVWTVDQVAEEAVRAAKAARRLQEVG